MGSSLIKSITTRFLLLFVVGFILTLPFPYYFFPDIGELLRPITESIGKMGTSGSTDFLYSDSNLMFRWTLILLGISAILTSIWVLIKPETQRTISFLLYRISAYYLSLTLLIYGLNKLFKYQFYFPEPNTLFTPIGQLSPDILYWSSMGTSYSYSVFAGLIEILPAFLLLFRKTRFFGAFISLAVLTNVMMINIGFDISVKLYTSFLLLLALILLAPHFKRMFAFFIGNSTVAPYLEEGLPNSTPFHQTYRFLKPILIGLILFESLGTYFETGEFNGDKIEKPYMFGAYQVANNPSEITHLFFHSKGYFIIQNQDGLFHDFEMRWDADVLKLTNYDDQQAALSLIKHPDETFNLSGLFLGKHVDWDFERIDLEGLAIYGV